MKTFRVSGPDPFFGPFGGIRAVDIEAETAEEARKRAREKYGETFGKPLNKGFSKPSADPYGLKAREVEPGGTPFHDPELPPWIKQAG